MVNPIKDQYNMIIDREGTTLIVNGTTTIKCLIKEIEDNTENDEKMIFAPLYSINQGDLVHMLGERWLVTKQEINFNEVYEKAKIQFVNFDVKFNYEGDVVTYPAIVKTSLQDIDYGKMIALFSGKMVVTLTDNAESRRIQLNQRFINSGRAWLVNGMDKTRKGLITLNCELSQISSDDDMEEEIADRWLYEEKHVYTLAITNGEQINVTEGTTQPLTIEVTDNGVVMSALPPLTFISSDETILTVDSNGVISPISIGIASVHVSMTNVSNVGNTINVEVIEAIPEDNYAIAITNSISTLTSLKLGQSATYTANITNNNATVTDKTVTWTVTNQDGSGTAYVTTTASTGTTITLKASSTSGYVGKIVNLKATLTDDNSIICELQITIKSLF